MSNQNDNPDDSRLSPVLDTLGALLVFALFGSLILLGGLVTHTIFNAWRVGEMGPGIAVVFGLFGLLLMAVGAGYIYLALVGAPRFLLGIERNREKYRDRPWLINRQWRTRRVVHSTSFATAFMWLWCLLWWGILGFLWSVNKDLILADLRGSWGQAIPTSMPFVAGFIGLAVAISMTWQRYRFGDAVLSIETLPGYLGERFRGKVQAKVKHRLTEPVRVTLSCGSLRSRNTDSQTEWITDELWSQNHFLHPTQTTYNRYVVTLPIDIKLPPDLPESGHILDDPQIVWKLTITPGSVLDQTISSEFNVPVFARRQLPQPTPETTQATV